MSFSEQSQAVYCTIFLIIVVICKDSVRPHVTNRSFLQTNKPSHTQSKGICSHKSSLAAVEFLEID